MTFLCLPLLRSLIKRSPRPPPPSRNARDSVSFFRKKVQSALEDCNSSTHAACPFLPAACNAVMPSEFAMSLAPACRSNLTSSLRPAAARGRVRAPKPLALQQCVCTASTKIGIYPQPQPTRAHLPQSCPGPWKHAGHSTCVSARTATVRGKWSRTAWGASGAPGQRGVPC